MNPSGKGPADGKIAEIVIHSTRINVHYHEAGEGNNHIVFLQTGGAGTTAYMCWYANLKVFAEAGYHVYAPDALGFGLTEVTSGSAINTSDFILAYMRELRIERAHFVGNSMGSMTATRLAIEHSECVKSLILTGGEPRIDTDESRSIARDLGKTARMDFVRHMLSKSHVDFEDIKKATAAFFFDSDHPRINEMAQMRLAAINRPGVQDKERDAAFRQVERGRSNYTASDLAKLAAPTLLIHGRDEPFFYPRETAAILLECATRVAFLLPDCSSVLLSHCGHWPQIERAQTFNTLSLEFLRGFNERNRP